MANEKNSIKVVVNGNINPSEININNLLYKPFLSVLKGYCKEDVQKMNQYFTEHGIEYQKQYNSLYEILEHATKMASQFAKIFTKEGTGIFNYKLAQIIKDRNFKGGFNEGNFSKLIFDISSFDEEIRNEIIDSFASAPCRSFIAFKNIDDNVLELIYYKKGIYEKNTGELGIAQPRDRVSLVQNYKNPAENNYICADFAYYFTENLKNKGLDIDFSYSYNNANANVVVDILSDDIMKYGNMTPDEKEKEKRVEAIKEQAEEELKKERNLRRDSLEPESVKKTLITATSTQSHFIIDDDTTSDNLKEQLGAVISNYREKEVQKQLIRLEQAEKISENIYLDMRSIIDNGNSIVEAINVANQKYNNKDATNMASLMLTTDLIQISLKDKEIQRLNDEVAELIAEKEKLMASIAQREEKIRELNDELKEKDDKFVLTQKAYEESLNKIREHGTKALEETKMAYESKIGSLEGNTRDLNNEIIGKNALIKDLEARLVKAEEERFDKWNNRMSQTIDVLESKIANLEQGVLGFDDEDEYVRKPK